MSVLLAIFAFLGAQTCVHSFYMMVLKQLGIGSKVNVIRTGTFENCMKLETIKLWWRVEHIHKDAFKNCLSLQEFNGPYISHFHEYAFSNCTNLHEVKLDIGNVLQIY
jgi:hypothetical protein